LCTLVLVSVRLVRDGSWRGCVISGTWCTGRGILASSDGEGMRVLLQACVCSIALANLATLPPARRVPRSWLATTVLAQLGVIVAALSPMTCSALIDGVGWEYVGWNDVLHDCALALVLLSAALARWAAPAPTRSEGTPRLAGVPLRLLAGWTASLTGPCAVAGLFACPTLELATSRLAILLLETAALFGAQLAHTATAAELAHAAGAQLTAKAA
jgi:hypothetical protein